MLELFIKAQTHLNSALDNEDGQGLTEYALILALVAIAAVAVLGFLGDDIKSQLQSVVDEL